MKKYFRPVSAVAIAALALALMGALRIPALPVPNHAAMIYSPGNGDFAGYRIVVEPNGKASAIDGAGRGSGWLQPEITQRFFSDLAAAAPLAQLSNQTCSAAQPVIEAATVEVNPAIVLAWNGQRSPNLSCATDPRAARLLLDATTIQRALYVQAYRVRTMMVFRGTYDGSSTLTGYSQPLTYPLSYDFGFSNGRFSNGGFSMDRFSSGMSGSGNPFSANPYYANPLSGNPFTRSPLTGSPSNGNP